MPGYEFAPEVDGDLEDIARYTLEQWGEEQTMRYAAALDAHFAEIGKGRALSRTFLKHRSELRSSRCEKHVVFHLLREEQCPLILAVFHERMDLMTRLKGRI